MLQPQPQVSERIAVRATCFFAALKPLKSTPGKEVWVRQSPWARQTATARKKGANLRMFTLLFSRKGCRAVMKLNMFKQAASSARLARQ
jgi:hypothetical protein